MDFMTLQELIYEKDKNETLKIFKKTYKEYILSLGEEFLKKNTKDFLIKHTQKTDNFIKILFNLAIYEFFGHFAPNINQFPVTLISLGSYAREQLCVYSDIDMMICYRQTKGYDLKGFIEFFLQTLWSSGLKIGHRVHEIEDLFESSKGDITIKTAMIESRYIYGSKFLWTNIQNELKKIRKFDQKQFICQKIDEYQKRIIAYPSGMEIDIKEQKGTIRDANTLFWIANTIFGIDKIKDLPQNLIDEEEYKNFRIALEFLFKVRIALHLISKKKQDKLYFELLPQVAQMVGFLDTKSGKKETIFFIKLLESLNEINFFTKTYIEKITRSIFYDKSRLSSLSEFKSKKIFYKTYLIENILYSSFKTKPISIIQILKFLLTLDFKESKIAISPSFLRILKDSLYPKRATKEYISLIKALFYSQNLYEIVNLFLEAGVLAKLFPIFKKAINLPQFDGYHRFPVDIHSVLTLKKLENIEDNFVKTIFAKLNTDEKAFLRLILFLHDAGKGRGKDHSDLGANLFKNFAKKIELSQEFTQSGIILIKYHTLMSNTANREDIYNQNIIFSFISKIQTQKNLDLLYILTYCDLNSVSDNIYNPFISKLLNKLYQISKDSFLNQELLDEAKIRLKKENLLKKIPVFKDLKNIVKKNIFKIESNLLFLKHKPEEIIDLACWGERIDSFDYKIENKDHLSIEIIKKKDLNLGYLLGKLTYLNLRHMDIYKLYGGIKYFKIDFLDNAQQEELELLKNLIEDSFDMKKEIRLKKPIILKNEIDIDCDYSKDFAKMQINAKDQKGLMAYIVFIFDKLGYDIATAKIETIKNRARNFLLIEKNGNFCNNKQNLLQQLIEG